MGTLQTIRVVIQSGFLPDDIQILSYQTALNFHITGILAGFNREGSFDGYSSPTGFTVQSTDFVVAT